MSKGMIWWVIGGIAALILASVLTVTLTSKPTTDSVPNQAPASTAEPTQQPDSQSAIDQPAEGTYQQYSAEALANSTADHKLIFFYAPWCPQCRALEKSIEQTGVPSGVAIFKIDFDTATAERKKYGVTIQTSIVEIDDQGDLIQKHVAYDEPNLLATLKAFGL